MSTPDRDRREEDRRTSDVGRRTSERRFGDQREQTIYDDRKRPWERTR